MQAQLFGEQSRLSSIFCIPPAATAETRQMHVELREEIGDDEEAFLNAEEDELDDEPNEGEEVIFDAAAPMLETDLAYTRYENEAEIRTIKEEIEELEAKLI